MAVVLAGVEHPRGSRMAVRGSKPDAPIGTALRPIHLGSRLAVRGSECVRNLRLGECTSTGVWQFLLSNIPPLRTICPATPLAYSRAQRCLEATCWGPPHRYLIALSQGPNIFPGDVATKQQRLSGILRNFFGARACVSGYLLLLPPRFPSRGGSPTCLIHTGHRRPTERLSDAIAPPTDSSQALKRSNCEEPCPDFFKAFCPHTNSPPRRPAWHRR